MSKAEELADLQERCAEVWLDGSEPKKFRLETAAELRRLAAENKALREERTAWRVTAENAEAAVKQARIDALEEAAAICQAPLTCKHCGGAGYTEAGNYHIPCFCQKSKEDITDMLSVMVTMQQPSMTPEQVREGIANNIEDVFRAEKVWTVLQTAAYIRALEVNGTSAAQAKPEQAKPCNHEWVHTSEGSPWLHCERCGASYRNPLTAEAPQPKD